jgi:hypothetical protein
MTIELLIQFINVVLDGCCKLVQTMQANPLGAVAMIVITALVTRVAVVWLKTRCVERRV